MKYNDNEAAFQQKMLSIPRTARVRVADALRRTLSREVDGSAGSEAEPVVFAEDVATRYNISTKGRMAITEGGRIFFAGPKKFDDVNVAYTPYVPSSAFSVGLAYVGNRVDIGPYVKCVPRDEISSLRSQVLSYYEEQLFIKHKVSLVVNPSVSTIRICKRLGILRMNICTSDARWRRDLEALGLEYGVFTDNPKDDDVVYLGSNGPVRCDRYQQWVCFQVDPSQELFNKQKTAILGTRLVTSYERGGYDTEVYLPLNGVYITYNSETVQKHFSAESRLLVLLSSHDLCIEEHDQYSGHTVFLDDYPHEQDIDGVRVRLAGNVLYDVAGPGTYCSRRGFIDDFAIDHGFEVAKFKTTGAFCLSPLSLRPIPVPRTNGNPTIHAPLNSRRTSHVVQCTGTCRHNDVGYIWSLIPFEGGQTLGLGFFQRIPVHVSWDQVSYHTVPFVDSHVFSTFDQMQELIPFLSQGESLWQRSWTPSRVTSISGSISFFQDQYQTILQQGSIVAGNGSRANYLSFFSNVTNIWFKDSSRLLIHVDISKYTFPLSALKTYRKTVISVPNLPIPDPFLTFLADNGFYVYTVSHLTNFVYWVCVNEYIQSERVFFTSFDGGGLDIESSVLDHFLDV